MIIIEKENEKKNKIMKLIKLISIIAVLSFFSTATFSKEKADCSKIKNDTLVGNLKTLLCKKGSDKLNKDGNFKKGTFNFFKKNK